MGSRPRLYALYRDDDFIALGTIAELEEMTGIKRKTLLFYESPSHMARTGGHSWVLVRIEENDDVQDI